MSAISKEERARRRADLARRRAAAARIRDLALRAMDDPDALPVLGDAVLESGWFDKRVCQVMFPIAPRRRGVILTRNDQARRRALRERYRAGYPDLFGTYAASPTAGWARAIVAVFLFGAWRHKRWPLPQRTPEVYRYEDVRLFVDGREITASPVNFVPTRDGVRAIFMSEREAERLEAGTPPEPFR